MKKNSVFQNDWLTYHPYTRKVASDTYYIELANRFLSIWDKHPIGDHIPTEVKKQLSCRFAAYFEDLVSETNIWNSFINKNKELYGKYLPFYSLGDNYVPGEPNPEDMQYLMWHYIQLYVHSSFIDPNDEEFRLFAQEIYEILDNEYETAPANEELKEQVDEDFLFTASYLYGPANEQAIRHTMQEVQVLTKGQPLSQKSALLAKRLREQVDQCPCVPLSLYADEWMDIISGNEEAGLREEAPENAKETIERDYKAFCKATGNYPLAYFSSVEAVNDFFVKALGWKADELPAFEENCKAVVVFANPDKGLLIATNINACIKDERNPLYNKEKAQFTGASLFLSPGVCPVDLLKYLETHDMLPDAMIECEKGEAYSKALLHENWDFLARWFLREYYRA